ncbi:putative DD41D transposase [Trichonephila clavipes]|nr:putative DD41D transposase [Trichonephila clavipes]
MAISVFMILGTQMHKQMFRSGDHSDVKPPVFHPQASLGRGSNRGEDMDVCKCIVPLRHGSTPNSRRAACPLVWLVEDCQVIYSQFGLAVHHFNVLSNGPKTRLPLFPKKRILFSDEAHFWLNGYVNKQNCRIWSEANPQDVETPLHPEKLTFGALYGLVESFFKNDEGHNFQQDGATCHTARATIDLLKDTFGDRLISRFGPVNWPPRSCDLTPLDYFLWSYVKSLVYADKPQRQDNIRRVIADIRPQMLEKVIENWMPRLDYIRASRGSPMQEIIFKM